MCPWPSERGAALVHPRGPAAGPSGALSRHDTLPPLNTSHVTWSVTWTVGCGLGPLARGVSHCGRSLPHTPGRYHGRYGLIDLRLHGFGTVLAARWSLSAGAQCPMPRHGLAQRRARPCCLAREPDGRVGSGFRRDLDVGRSSVPDRASVSAAQAGRDQSPWYHPRAWQRENCSYRPQPYELAKRGELAAKTVLKPCTSGIDPGTNGPRGAPLPTEAPSGRRQLAVFRRYLGVDVGLASLPDRASVR